jgi:hypothetical protein
MTFKKLAVFIFILIFFGCQKPLPEKGIWVGTLTMSENKPLPFRMFVDPNSAQPKGYFINGDEQVQIPEIRIHGDSLLFFFSEYNASMLGIWNGSELRGRFFRYRSDTTSNEFVSAPAEKIKTEESVVQNNPSLGGKFQSYLADQNGIDSTSIATFWVRNDSIFGTLYAADGDYGLFTGTQTGSRAVLTRFTGWQAFLMELDQQGNGWKGKLYARSGKPTTISLVPLSKYSQEPRLIHVTTMKNPQGPFSCRPDSRQFRFSV